MKRVSSDGTTPAVPVPGERFPDYRRSVALKYVKRGFHILLSHSFTIVALPLAAFGVLELLNLYNQGELQKLVLVARQTELTFDLITLIGCVSALVVAVLCYFALRQRPVYLVDFSVYKAPDSWTATYQRFMNGSRNCGKFTQESLEFQEKILARSGLGQNTYLPPGVDRGVDRVLDTLTEQSMIRTNKNGFANSTNITNNNSSTSPAAAVACTPPCPTMGHAREEFEEVMFTTVQDLLDKTGVHPKQIGILVVNCSLFNPTPSLAAMVINHFKMRSNIISYNLSGMGCGSSPVSIDLARQMLQLYPHSYALVISTENITQNWYFGNDRSMLMPNCLFRVGGAAMLLSNRRRDAWRAKYELMHTVRTHLGANDLAYKCIFQMEDDDGNVGVRLSKELMAVAGEALKVNVTTLGPLVLPISEQVLFIMNLILRKVFKRKIKPYIPDFKLAFDKVCIHTGGRAVIDEIEKQLQLTNDMVEPSRATLYRYGNTSSSSIWYVLSYIESHVGMNRGDRIWQMGFGSGFKCNSAVWRARRKIKQVHNAWADFDVQTMRDHLATLPNHKKQAPKAVDSAHVANGSTAQAVLN